MSTVLGIVFCSGKYMSLIATGSKVQLHVFHIKIYINKIKGYTNYWISWNCADAVHMRPYAVKRDVIAVLHWSHDRRWFRVST